MNEKYPEEELEEDNYCSWCNEEVSDFEEHDCFNDDEWDSLVDVKWTVKKMREDRDD